MSYDLHIEKIAGGELECGLLIQELTKSGIFTENDSISISTLLRVIGAEEHQAQELAKILELDRSLKLTYAPTNEEPTRGEILLSFRNGSLFPKFGCPHRDL